MWTSYFQVVFSKGFFFFLFPYLNRISLSHFKSNFLFPFVHLNIANIKRKKYLFNYFPYLNRISFSTYLNQILQISIFSFLIRRAKQALILENSLALFCPRGVAILLLLLFLFSKELGNSFLSPNINLIFTLHDY